MTSPFFGSSSLSREVVLGQGEVSYAYENLLQAG